MTDIIERIFEISLGSVLIGITLISSAVASVMSPVLILLPLFAAPIICSGLFGWHPFKSFKQLLARATASVKQIEIIKPHSSSL